MKEPALFEVRTMKKRRLLPLWAWFAIPIISALVAYLIAVAVTGARVEGELRRLKASGAPVTLAEAASPQVPDDQNAAVLYEQAFQWLPQDRDGHTTEPDPIAFFGSTDQEKRAKVSLKPVEEILSRYAPLFTLLEQAAAHPACRFPVKWEAGSDAVFPHMAKIRSVSRMLAAKAVVDAHHGDTPKALRDITLIFRICDHIASEPSLVSQFVRFACQAIALNTLNRVMRTAPLSAADARRMYEALRKIDNVRPFTHAMEGERCMGLWLFDAVRRDPSMLAQLPVLASGEAISESQMQRTQVGARLLVALGGPFLNQDQVFYIEHMNGVVAASRLPFRGAQKRYAALQQSVEALPKHAIITRILGADFSRTTEARDKAVARIGLAQHAMALRVYQIETGRYPASLAELRAKVKWPLPPDPFTGKDFVYRRAGTGYLLYSIGPNMRDEAGKDDRPFRGAPGHYPPDDLPWRTTR
jgi:hypothetical protein